MNVKRLSIWKIITYCRRTVAKFRLGKGEGVYLFDTSGKAYLDFVSGIAVNALGYGDPEVLEDPRTEQEMIHVSNLYHTIRTPNWPVPRRTFVCGSVFFCNSGTEAWKAR